MTIISVVYVPEGIAMAADSRLTGSKTYPNGLSDRFTVSDNAQKLVLLRESTIGISFCGNAIIDKKTVSDFLRIFDIQEVKRADTVEQVAINLQKMLKEKYDNYNVNFIMAGFDDDEPFVFKVSKDRLNRQNYEDENIVYGAAWDGEIEPVTKLLKGSAFNFNLMPLKDAVDFSEFMAEIAIKYGRFTDSIATCGGPIDLLVITKDYTSFFRHKIL